MNSFFPLTGRVVTTSVIFITYSSVQSAEVCSAGLPKHFIIRCAGSELSVQVSCFQQKRFPQGDLATVISPELNKCKPLIVMVCLIFSTEVSTITAAKASAKPDQWITSNWPAAASVVVKENVRTETAVAAVQRPTSLHYLYIYIQNKHVFTATQCGFLTGVSTTVTRLWAVQSVSALYIESHTVKIYESNTRKRCQIWQIGWISAAVEAWMDSWRRS